MGNMGAHMARNLLKSGKTLSVFDLNQSAVDDLTSSGATAAASPAEAADGATTIITMLPSSPHVEAVFTGENGIFETLGTDVRDKLPPSTLFLVTPRTLIGRGPAHLIRVLSVR